MTEGTDDDLNILVIDDDEAMRELLVQAITAHGHQVVTADSAESGLELLPFWTFQIAILDHNLPGMEGLMLGEYLRRQNPHMEILLITGSDDERLPRRTEAVNISLLPKPFDLSVIIRHIEDYRVRARERMEEARAEGAPDYAPSFTEYAEDFGAAFSIPAVPDRVTDRIIKTIQRRLNNLRSSSRYTDLDRSVVLAGLLTAKVLGVDLPRTHDGTPLEQEYDRLMENFGKRREFS